MINHEMLVDYYSNLFESIATMDLKGEQPNIATTFNKYAKRGEFDHLSDDEYESFLDFTNTMAKQFWNNSLSISLADLVQRSAAAAVPSQKDVRKIAEILASAYEAASPDLKLGGAYVAFPYPIPARTLSSVRSAASIESPEVLAMSPQDIFAKTGNDVWGQQGARRAMSLLLWHHLQGNPRNVLIAGPTGCGKSLLVSSIERLYGNVVEVDGAQLTAEGWKGGAKLSNIFAGRSQASAEHAIVVIDEADKLFESKTSAHGENYSFQIQNELLKLMDGGTVKASLDPDKPNKLVALSCAHMSFVFLGAFETMLKAKNAHGRSNGIGFGGTVSSCVKAGYEDEFTSHDLEQYAGVRREIAGRISHIVQMRPLSIDDYLAIIDDPERSPLPNLEVAYGRTLVLSDEEKLEIAQRAFDSGLGVRSITAQLQDRMDDELFPVGDAKDDPCGALRAAEV